MMDNHMNNLKSDSWGENTIMMPKCFISEACDMEKCQWVVHLQLLISWKMFRMEQRLVIEIQTIMDGIVIDKQFGG